MPLLRKKKPGSPTETASNSGGFSLTNSNVSNSLVSFGARRVEFLRCSGMHTEPVRKVFTTICQGRVRGPGVGYVAPALLEGIPEFLDKTMYVSLSLNQSVVALSARERESSQNRTAS